VDPAQRRMRPSGCSASSATSTTEKFLSSSALGLEGMPDAVACAAYHYLSNSVGASPSSSCARATARPG
jgi:hypothetical protein